MFKIQTIAIVFGFLLAASSLSRAADLNCEHCGACCECRKVCRVVCEMKEVTKTTWSCKCEDFCVPGPSQRCAVECGCGTCKECRMNSWIPTAAAIRTRKVPVKHVETFYKPTYRFVVETLCDHCASCVK